MLSTLCPVDATNDVDTDFINLLSANSKLFDQEPVNKLFTPPCSKAVVRLFQYESEFASKTNPDVSWATLRINPVLAFSSTLKDKIFVPWLFQAKLILSINFVWFHI